MLYLYSLVWYKKYVRSTGIVRVIYVFVLTQARNYCILWFAILIISDDKQTVISTVNAAGNKEDINWL